MKRKHWWQCCKLCRHSTVMSQAGGDKPTLFGNYYGFRRYLACFKRPRLDEVKWHGWCSDYDYSVFNRAGFEGYKK